MNNSKKTIEKSQKVINKVANQIRRNKEELQKKSLNDFK